MIRPNLTIKLFALALILGAVATILIPSRATFAVTGSQWRAGYIISDSVMFNNKTLNTSQIQAFLNAKVPTCDTNGTQMYTSTMTRAQYGTSKGYPPPYTCLKNYSQSVPATAADSLCSAIAGGTESSAQIINDVSQACGINPQALLVILQKEQALVTDDWPWPIQYQAATGYGCPDTAACSSQYYGFFNQVYHAARFFKAPPINYPAGQSDNILYNPTAACGSSAVYVENQTTGNLYDYTPYQPNQAALNNLYGNGDSCSAYGNRNFWRYFNDWFGSTGGGVDLIQSSAGGTIYARYGGMKQGIPNSDVLNAWGLGSLPINTLDDASVQATPTRSSSMLSREVKNPYNPNMLLLADNGGFYNAWPNMISDWGMDPSSAASIGPELLTATSWSANLSPFVTPAGGSAIYMVDNGAADPFSSGTQLNLWGGGSPNINTVSTSLFNTLSSGQGIFTNLGQVTSGSTYIADGGLLTVPSNLTNLYNYSTPLQISSNLSSVLPSHGSITQFIKSGSSPGIFMVDAGKKLGFDSPQLLQSYTPSNGQTPVTVLSDAAIGMIPVGQQIHTRFAYPTSTPSTGLYINGAAQKIPSEYRSNNYGVGLSDAALALYGNQTSWTCNDFIQIPKQPGIFMVDAGQKRPINTINDFLMLKQTTSSVCQLPAEDVNALPWGQAITPYVSVAGQGSYLIDQNTYYTVPDAATQNSWGIGSYSSVDAAFLANYPAQATLSSNFLVNNVYTLVNGGRYYQTANPDIAALWGISSSQSHSPSALARLTNKGALSQFAHSDNSSDYGIYLEDQGKFLPILSLDDLYNSGYNGQNIVIVDATTLAGNTGPTWQGYLAKDSSSNVYMLEGGKKHLVDSSLYSNWLGTTSPIQPTLLSHNFLNLLRAGAAATKSITTGQPGIYGIDNGQKAGIPDMQTYTAKYAPALTVTQSLVNAMPDGPVIQSVNQ